MPTIDKGYTKLYAGNTTVLQIATVNDKMQFTWDEEWTTWTEFQNDQDVIDTIAKAELLLNSSVKGKSKGKNGR